MKETIKRIAEHVIDMAGELGIQADKLTDVDPGISGAEAVLHLRDALQSLNAAKDALTWALLQRIDSIATVGSITIQ